LVLFSGKSQQYYQNYDWLENPTFNHTGKLPVNLDYDVHIPSYPIMPDYRSNMYRRYPKYNTKWHPSFRSGRYNVSYQYPVREDHPLWHLNGTINRKYEIRPTSMMRPPSTPSSKFIFIALEFKLDSSQPGDAGFESRPGRKFSNQIFPFLDRDGYKIMCLEVMRKRCRGTILEKVQVIPVD
jgi:hypothetical protein